MSIKSQKIPPVYSNLITGKVRARNLDNVRERPVSKIMLHTANEVETAENLARRSNNDKDVPPYHYYIDSKGEIWALLPENYTSPTFSSSEIEEVGISILISNSYMDPSLPVSAQAIEALVDLCEDISRRYAFPVKFTNDTSGSLLGHYCTARTECPGIYVKAKMHEISLRVTNRIKGLPDKPMLERGVFRVRSAADDRNSQIGIFRDLNEAIARAYKNHKNVYDVNGMEVYNYKLSSLVTVWDLNAPKHVGDYVKSVEALVDVVPGSNRCYVLRDGEEVMFVPDLGGLVPMAYISLSDTSKKKYPDHSIHAGKTTVYMDEGVVEEVDEENNIVYVHGHPWPMDKLLVRRRTIGLEE